MTAPTDSAPLADLLFKLSSGDAGAAEQVFRTHEAYLRIVVRRMLPVRLRPQFDSVDVVQSVWADLLVGFQRAAWTFDSPAQLRAFLIKVTRNRFIDRVRQQRRALDHRRSLDSMHRETIADPGTDSPSAAAQADDLWQQMMALCPAHHRQILRLKRAGGTLADIAHHTGLHQSSVRRILYDLARKLAAKQ